MKRRKTMKRLGTGMHMVRQIPIEGGEKPKHDERGRSEKRSKEEETRRPAR